MNPQKDVNGNPIDSDDEGEEMQQEQEQQGQQQQQPPVVMLQPGQMPMPRPGPLPMPWPRPRPMPMPPMPRPRPMGMQQPGERMLFEQKRKQPEGPPLVPRKRRRTETDLLDMLPDQGYESQGPNDSHIYGFKDMWW